MINRTQRKFVKNNYFTIYQHTIKLKKAMAKHIALALNQTFNENAEDWYDIILNFGTESVLIKCLTIPVQIHYKNDNFFPNKKSKWKNNMKVQIRKIESNFNIDEHLFPYSEEYKDCLKLHLKDDFKCVIKKYGKGI